MELSPLLKKIGFRPKEIQIYLTAIQIGAQPASIIAEKTGLNRVTTYMTLKKLVQKGLAQTCYRNGMQFFSVNNPEKLLLFASRKEDEWKDMQHKLRKAITLLEIPEFQNLSPIEVKSFQGIEGFKSVVPDIVKAESLLILSQMDNTEGSYIPYLINYVFPKLKKHTSPACFFFKQNSCGKENASLLDRKYSIPVHCLSQLPFDTDIFILDERMTIFIDRKQNILSGAVLMSPTISKNLQASLKFILLQQSVLADTSVERKKVYSSK